MNNLTQIKMTDLEFKRLLEFIAWMIDGYAQHGITPMRFPDLTPERVEELYNVEFSKS